MYTIRCKALPVLISFAIRVVENKCTYMWAYTLLHSLTMAGLAVTPRIDPNTTANVKVTTKSRECAICRLRQVCRALCHAKTAAGILLPAHVEQVQCVESLHHIISSLDILCIHMNINRMGTRCHMGSIANLNPWQQHAPIGSTCKPAQAPC